MLYGDAGCRIWRTDNFLRHELAEVPRRRWQPNLVATRLITSRAGALEMLAAVSGAIPLVLRRALAEAHRRCRQPYLVDVQICLRRERAKALRRYWQLYLADIQIFQRRELAEALRIKLT